MSKRIFIFLLGAVFLFPLRSAFASVIINEIMYAPPTGSTHEWLEIYNNGNSSVDLTDWRFFNNQTDSAPLRLQKGSAVLGASQYAIITKTLDGFTSDWPSFSGTIFTSSQFSLPDDSSTTATYKAISDSNKQIIDSLTYDTSLGGSKDSGNSLQKIFGSWVGATPTPGAANNGTSGNTNTNTTTSNSSSGSDTIGSPLVTDYSTPTEKSTSSTKTQTQEKKIKTHIIMKTLGFVSSPLSFSATSFGTSGEPLGYGKYFWNFGDGDFKETKINDFEKVTHAYMYAGEYTVTLQYYMNPYVQTPDASDEMTVKIVPLDIAISNTGDEKDFFVELANNTSYEMDISGWFLVTTTKSFLMPQNTIIGSKKKTIVSSKLTGFSISDKDTLKLITPQRYIAFDYSPMAHSTPKKTTNESKKIRTVVNTESKVSKEIPKTETTDEIKLVTEPIPADDLSASAISSNVVESSSGSSYLYTIVFIVLVLVGAGGVYFVRRKKVDASVGDNFEIMEE